ncbi:hypothetical protein AB0D38_47075, partial [Streptomyces sp. NPDC048279]|uniref:hypothetical protein n=1 Tax=Streptomyces sp. NPDC048279 TaxID=3154714 RepID=UPI00344855E7
MHTTPGASEVSRSDLGTSDVPESGGTRYIIVGAGAIGGTIGARLSWALRDYHLLPSVRGDLLARLGRTA